MGNICENRLRATGCEEQVDLLAKLIKKSYETENFDEDYIESDDLYQLELYFDTSWKFPKDHFRKITSALPDTLGLNIRVASDEPATNYLEQSIFQDGKWNFDKEVDVVTEIDKLRKNGILQIRQFLTEKGNVYIIDEDQFWIALYVNNDGDGTSSFIRSIEIDTSGKIFVNLDDGMSLYEDEITANHVLDILTIMVEEHGTYTK